MPSPAWSGRLEVGFCRSDRSGERVYDAHPSVLLSVIEIFRVDRVRTKGLGGGKEAWLLIKHRDEHCQAGYDANDYDSSAASTRTLAQIAEEG